MSLRRVSAKQGQDQNEADKINVISCGSGVPLASFIFMINAPLHRCCDRQFDRLAAFAFTHEFIDETAMGNSL